MVDVTLSWMDGFRATGGVLVVERWPTRDCFSHVPGYEQSTSVLNESVPSLLPSMVSISSIGIPQLIIILQLFFKSCEWECFEYTVASTRQARTKRATC